MTIFVLYDITTKGTIMSRPEKLSIFWHENTQHGEKIKQGIVTMSNCMHVPDLKHVKQCAHQKLRTNSFNINLEIQCK